MPGPRHRGPIGIAPVGSAEGNGGVTIEPKPVRHPGLWVLGAAIAAWVLLGALAFAVGALSRWAARLFELGWGAV